MQIDTCMHSNHFISKWALRHHWKKAARLAGHWPPVQVFVATTEEGGDTGTMPKRSSTRKPKEDFSQTAFRIVQELTSEKPKETKPDVAKALEDAQLRKQIMREMGRRGGQKGGKARAKKLTAEQRSAIAKRAAATRWDNS